MKIMLATPMYGGTAHGGYVCGVATLFALCAINKIDIVIEYMTHESLIPRARNMLVKMFMNKPDYTHLLFIDADIHFNAHDILKLLELDKDIIGLPYAKKLINWNSIQEQCKNAEGRLSVELLQKCGLSYILRCESGQDTTADMYEAQEIGTGIMMIKREVIEKMILAYPDLYAYSDDTAKYRDDDIEGRKYYLLFETMLIDENRRYLSEDYAFCKRWRDIGGKIHVYLPVKTIHFGSYAYEYDSSTIKLC
jgi:hypothetical protein